MFFTIIIIIVKETLSMALMGVNFTPSIRKSFNSLNGFQRIVDRFSYLEFGSRKTGTSNTKIGATFTYSVTYDFSSENRRQNERKSYLSSCNWISVHGHSP